MNKVILVTGAGTGIGRLTVRSLAAAGHTVYGTMRDPDGRNAAKAADLRQYASEHGVDLHIVELDVLSESSAEAAVAAVLERSGRLDVVVHNAAHLYYGITEAFTPEQVLRAFDTNAVGALRVNRAALPAMRRQGSGLLVWVGGGTSMVVPPFLAPYTAAKAAMDSFAESVSVEVARYGIETSIVMPGPFTQGTAHFPNAEPARDEHLAANYHLITDAVANNGAATESLFAPGWSRTSRRWPTRSSGSSTCRTASGHTGARSTSPTSATSRCRPSPRPSGSACSAASGSATC